MENIRDYEAMAKLNLPEDERVWAQGQAALLEESFTALSAVNCADTAPLVNVLEMKNVLREDIAVKNFTREELLAGAPEQLDGYFQVPKTID